MIIVSIIMSTLNTPERYLRQSIESILNQTFKDFEFIIVDDGSLGKDIEIIESYNDPRIHVIKNVENKGLPFSLNEAIIQSSGKYIARMDSDDIALPHRIEKQYRYMELHNDVQVLGAVARTFGKKKKTIISPQYEEVNEQLFFRSSIVHPSVMIRRDFLIENGLLYNESFKCSQDFELWSRIVGKGRISIVPEVLMMYRTHETQISSTKSELQKEYGYSIYQNLFKRLGVIISREEYEAHYSLVNDKVAQSYSDLLLWCKKLSNAKREKCIHKRAFFQRQIYYYLVRNTLGHLAFRNYKFDVEKFKVIINPVYEFCFIFESIRRGINRVTIVLFKYKMHNSVKRMIKSN